MPLRSEPWPTGAPCWVDLGVPDTSAARDFYASVFGWTFSGGDEPEYGGYLTCERGGGQVAGLGPQQDPSDPPRWTTYFATDDADRTAAAVAAAGGAVLAGPLDVGPMGRMAIAADPQGLVFGLWQAGLHRGITLVGEPGAVVWSEAHAPDTEAARRFYGEVFGLAYEPIPGEMDYTVFTVAGVESGGPGSGGIAGVGGGPGDERPEWLTYFSAPDVDAAVTAVEAGGGSVVTAAEDTPYGRMAVVADPWGARFAVMDPAPM